MAKPYNMRRSPSIKRLCSMFPDVAPRDLAFLKDYMVNALYVSEVDDALELANRLLGGHGVEAVKDNQWANYYMDIGLLYVNTGDCYNATLIYDTRSQCFYATDLGAILERNERRFA